MIYGEEDLMHTSRWLCQHDFSPTCIDLQLFTGIGIKSCTIPDQVVLSSYKKV
jgi:hypothetical protein